MSKQTPHWKTIAEENLMAAQLLGDSSFYRSCASRAYYAAFSAVSFALRARAPFAGGRETPPHHRLVSLIEQQLQQSVPVHRVRLIKSLLRRLFTNRINSDYKSGFAIDQNVARESRADARAVCRFLGAN